MSSFEQSQQINSLIKEVLELRNRVARLEVFIAPHPHVPDGSEGAGLAPTAMAAMALHAGFTTLDDSGRL